MQRGAAGARERVGGASVARSPPHGSCPADPFAAPDLKFLRARALSEQHKLEDTVFLEAMRAWGALPEAVLQGKELQQAILPALRADIRMFEMYRPEGHTQKLPLPIVSMVGADDAKCRTHRQRPQLP